MFAFLLLAGILIALGGCFALGFGIPNNGFDLGNTLIIAGAASIGAGVIVIGLAACLRELRRISGGAPARQAARPSRGGDVPADVQPVSTSSAPSPRMPYPAKPTPEIAAREPRPIEPVLGAPLSEPPPFDEPASERQRPPVFATGRNGGEPPVEEPDAMPLAPTRGPAAPLGRTPAPTTEPAYEPKFGPADILARLGGSRAAQKAGGSRPVSPGERPLATRGPAERVPAERAAEPAPPPERSRGPMFEAVWPTGGKPPGRAAGPDTIPRVSKSEPALESKTEPRERFEPPPLRSEPPPLRSEPAPMRTEAPPMRAEPPALRSEPPMVAEPREAPRAAPDPRSVSILKSGVIDGMAYTLYTDGSIEAQLPQGTMRFASIEELRTHLEAHEPR